MTTMANNGWEDIMANLSQELNLIEVKAKTLSANLEILCRESECLKLEYLQQALEEHVMSEARARGISLIMRDKKQLRNSLLMAAGSFVFGGLVTKDKWGALTAGMSGFDSMVQGFGERKWCVILSEKISVVPEGMVPANITWVTLDSFYRTTEELKKQASAGKKMGNLNDIISKFKKNRN